MGLPSLKGVQLDRVRLANQLYELTKRYICILQERNVGWSVENPASSLMWITDSFVELMQTFPTDMFGVLFHTCMFGAQRRKQTAIWTNIKELCMLNRTCSNDHEHAPWGLTSSGSFATAEECAYNADLCAHWANAIEQYAVKMGLTPCPDTLDAVGVDHLHVRDRANKAILGALPRGNVVPPLLSDFLQDMVVPLNQYQCLLAAKPGARLPDNAHFPKGTRLLQVWNDYVGEIGQSQSDDKATSSNGEAKMLGAEKLMARVGVPAPPLDYVAKAIGLVHPNLLEVNLSAAMEEALSFCRPGKSLELRKTRIGWTRLMLEAMESSKDKEKELTMARPDHLQSVLKGKKFGLLHSALETIGYSDACVALEASSGFPLVGWMKSSGVFASRPPEIHISALESMAASYSARTLASIKPSTDEELDEQVWRATLEEVDGGTLDGPFDINQLPKGHLVSPRFGIRQGQKVRPIDNLSASGINASVGLPERLQVDSIDEVAAVIKRCMQTTGSECSLVGRTYDLKRAYRQLGVRADHMRFSWIAVWSTEHKSIKLFRMKGLPFGGTASVASFLRMSRALRELGVAGPALVWSAFFDDFICISRPEDSESADMAVRFLFKVCGWVLSEDPDKDQDFKAVFGALGVEVDLRRVGEGVLQIGNTLKRKEEVRKLVSEHLSQDRLSQDDSESLRSRLMFSEAQVFGRSSKIALKAIGMPALLGQDCSPLSDEIRFGLTWMMNRIVHGGPRMITATATETLHLFVDGACEPDEECASGLATSVGAVLLDSSGRGLYFFGLRLPHEVTNAWANGSKRNLVFEAEILPYYLALECWSETLRRKHLIVYIDNDGARHSWIKGTADAVFARAMVHQGTLAEAELELASYFARVPTASNLADGPSRLDFGLCKDLGAAETTVSLNLLRKCSLDCLMWRK